MLQKANIDVPHFTKPKLLSFIITVHDSKENDENENKSSEQKMANAKTKGTSETSQSNAKNEVIQTQAQQDEQQSNGSTNANLPNNVDGKAAAKPKLPELKEVQSFGSVDLIPVSNSSVPELKVHEKPVKNYVEITPLPSSQNDKVISKPEITCDLVPLKEQPNNIQG